MTIFLPIQLMNVLVVSFLEVKRGHNGQVVREKTELKGRANRNSFIGLDMSTYEEERRQHKPEFP